MSEIANQDTPTNRGATRAVLAGIALLVIVPFLGYGTLLASLPQELPIG